MVLNECAETGHGKVFTRTPESLAKLIRPPCEKIRKRPEEIYAARPVRHVGPQSHAIHRSTHFPKMFAPRSGVRVVSLIMIFPALAVPGVAAAEGHAPG